MDRQEAIEAIKAKMDYYESDKRLRAALETLIPELRESEDERIRKEIISALKFANDGGVYDKHIAYLEKQKEQKPAESKVDVKILKDIDLALRGLYDALQQKNEWSEEDEERLDSVISFLFVLDSYISDDSCISDDTTTKARDVIKKVLVPWLKDLPNRPKPADSWKPSDEKAGRVMIEEEEE